MERTSQSIVGFLKIYKKVVRYSPDNTDSNEDFTDFKINKKDFLTKLFIDRDAVKKLKQTILLEDENLLCIAGPRGTGKTSIGLKTIDLLRRDEVIKSFVIYFDIRRDHAKKNITTHKEAIDYFSLNILNEYKSKFISRPHLGLEDPDIKLLSFILDDTKKRNKPNIIFNDLVDEISLFNRFRFIKDRGYEFGISEFILEYYGEPVLNDILNGIRKKLNLFHYSFAIREVYNFKRQIIWIDNIDRLPNSEQKMLLEGLTEIKRGVINNIVLVVAVREENIFRLNHFEPYATPQISKIYWENPNKHINAKSFDAFNMPVANDEVLKEIINKRLSFAKDLQQLFINKIPPSTSTYEKNELKNTLGTVISDVVFERVKRLSNQIIKIFIDEKMYFFANNSLRQLLSLHREFLKYLIGNDNYNPQINSLKDPEWFLKTQLFYYLARNSDYSPFLNYNVVNDHNYTKSFDITCFLPQLILTTIWNQCIKNRRKSTLDTTLPSVKSIISKLSFLEYSKGEIQSEIYNLYNTKEGSTNFVTIETSKPILSPKQIDGDLKIKTTYKGKSMLNSISISFGYFYSLIINTNTKSQTTLASSSFISYGNKVIEIIKKISVNHFNSLIYIRNNIFKDNNNWFDEYLISYGIPFDPTYNRNPLYIGGRKVLSHGNIKHSIYLEALINSIEPFFNRYPTLKNDFEKMKNKFYDLLNKIITKSEDDITF